MILWGFSLGYDGIYLDVSGSRELYLLVNVYNLLLKMAIGMVDLLIKHGNSHSYVSLPERRPCNCLESQCGSYVYPTTFENIVGLLELYLEEA